MLCFGDLDLHQRGEPVSLIEQHSLGACNIGQHQGERGDMEETKEEETEKGDWDTSAQAQTIENADRL